MSIAGFGCGGNSRLGLGVGGSTADAVTLVRNGFDLGINLFDTAEAYGTEEVVGRALSAVPRDQIVVSTKSRILDTAGRPLPSAAVIENLEQSLRRLRMDHVDLFFLHAVQLQHYDYALSELVPALLEQRCRGKIAHLAISESPPRDPGHTMLRRALEDSCWDAFMLAFHMMNQRARTDVLPHTTCCGVGTMLMFVVRNIFSRPEVLRDTVSRLVREGLLPRSMLAAPGAMDFLIHEGGASSLTDAAYRFARHEPGVDVVLFGTSDASHLRSNVESLLKPPLPLADVERLRLLFGHLHGVGLDFPNASSMSIPLSSV